MAIRWVLNERNIQPKPFIKSHLPVHGFQEKSKVTSDSPAASKDSIRRFFAYAASKQRSCEND